ncbi:alpha/beta fold hydrolase [Microvirga lotononidis]|uniref:Putative hydrolase or acyltransferase of alpha/beta superfamily n=1 Tax=Microvirga lotononidis TaxID=864069 RepID=I4YTN9_9HYPH|nr:alpha/beta hydrolase [Microvirga lotononidis]EIM27331.1 putative hydrolase or acyltransferase of alpha/beta superfamily [Microvirga lotononidis]WQO28498.1 alpha/beta hydrolase [Microvirga lotononidis]
MSLLLALAVPLSLLALGAAFTYLYAWSIERRFPPTGRFVAVEGCRLHYREEGPRDGSERGTIVLLHGASSNLVESMLGMGWALSHRYRVLAFDRPGHGWSERRPGLHEAQPARQAALIARALRQLDVRDAVIVGHSWSGTIVPHFALDHTDVTGAILVLSGITSPWPGGYIGWYRRLIDSPVGWLLMRTLAVPVLLVLRPWMKSKTFRPQSAPPDIVKKGFIPLAFRPRAYEANMQDFAVMYEAVLRQSVRYGDIRLPVTVVAGDRDEIVWSDLHSLCFVRAVPGAELILMPGIGHMPQYADQMTVLAAIEALAGRVAPNEITGTRPVMTWE